MQEPSGFGLFEKKKGSLIVAKKKEEGGEVEDWTDNG